MLPEKWMKGVAITTTVLAVLASIAASRSGFCIAKNQVLTETEGSKWAYYQAKSIKQALAETQRDAFKVEVAGAAVPEQKQLLESALSTLDAEVARYEHEKNDIRKEAQRVVSSGHDHGRIDRI